MALTPGFKKFIGLICIVGAVGGGIVYYKSLPKTVYQPFIEQPAAPQPVEIPQPTNSPINQSRNLELAIPDVLPTAQPASQPVDVSSNRGMQNLLNYDQKQ